MGADNQAQQAALIEFCVVSVCLVKECVKRSNKYCGDTDGRNIFTRVLYLAQNTYQISAKVVRVGNKAFDTKVTQNDIH